MANDISYIDELLKQLRRNREEMQKSTTELFQQNVQVYDRYITNGNNAYKYKNEKK